MGGFEDQRHCGEEALNFGEESYSLSTKYSPSYSTSNAQILWMHSAKEEHKRCWKWNPKYIKEHNLSLFYLKKQKTDLSGNIQ